MAWRKGLGRVEFSECSALNGVDMGGSKIAPISCLVASNEMQRVVCVLLVRLSAATEEEMRKQIEFNS